MLRGWESTWILASRNRAINLVREVKYVHKCHWATREDLRESGYNCTDNVAHPFFLSHSPAFVKWFLWPIPGNFLVHGSTILLPPNVAETYKRGTKGISLFWLWIQVTTHVWTLSFRQTQRLWWCIFSCLFGK